MLERFLPHFFTAVPSLLSRLTHPFAPFYSSVLPRANNLFSLFIYIFSFSPFPPRSVIHLSSPPSSTPATTHRSCSEITESICDIRPRQLCQEQLPWLARHIWSVSALGTATNVGCPAQKNSHKYCRNHAQTTLSYACCFFFSRLITVAR